VGSTRNAQGVRAVYEPRVEQPQAGLEAEAEEEAAAGMTMLFLGQKPLRCRMGFHKWSGWRRLCTRRYEPSAGSEGFISFTLYQTRMCYECGEGQRDKDVLCVRTLTPLDAIGRDLITETERKTLRTSPLDELPIGAIQDREDGITNYTLETPGIRPMGLLCRCGFHRYRENRCVRCRHLGPRYRRGWPRGVPLDQRHRSM